MKRLVLMFALAATSWAETSLWVSHRDRNACTLLQSIMPHAPDGSGADNAWCQQLVWVQVKAAPTTRAFELILEYVDAQGVLQQELKLVPAYEGTGIGLFLLTDITIRRVQATALGASDFTVTANGNTMPTPTTAAVSTPVLRDRK